MLKKIFAAMKKYDALLGLFSLLLIFGGLTRVSSFHRDGLPKEVVPAVSGTAEETVAVPIIMYHGILKDTARLGKYVISPEVFEEDLKYLISHGYTTVVVQDLIDYVDRGVPLPEKPIMLTFDDGYYNNYLYAYPLLRKYNCRAVISVIGYYSQRFSENTDMNPYYAHLNWAQIRELSESGMVEIQNHSYNLHKNSGNIGAKKISGESVSDYTVRLSDDVKKLQSLLEEHSGVIPTAFTYPFGAVSDASVPILKESGFRASLSCEEKVNKITRNPDCLYRLYRFLRPYGKSSGDYFRKILPETETFMRK